MSGPGRLNFATLPVERAVADEHDEHDVVFGFALFARLANARVISACVDFPVARFASSSGCSAR